MKTDKEKNVDQDIESVSIKDFLILCLGYWKWFLLSVIFFGGLGLFYAYTRQPVYERSEEILIKDQDSGGGVSTISNAFSGLGLFSSSTKVYNELISFTSPAVIFEVVDRLNLTMNYDLHKGLKRQTLYGSNLPLNIEFPDLTDKDNVGFGITVQPDGSFKIKKIWKAMADGKIKFDDEISGKVNGTPVNSPIGQIVVVKNENYIPNEEIDGKEMVIDVFKQSRQLAVEKYSAKLKGDLSDQDADIIKLSIEDTSVQRADDILNTIILVYNERWIEDNNKVAVATSKFITERLALIEKELGEVDEMIADQKSSMKLPDLREAAKGYMAQDFKLNEEILTVTNSLAMSGYLKEFLQNPENNFTVLPSISGTGSVTLEEQIASYNSLLLSTNKLIDNSGLENPIVKDLKKDLEGRRAAIIRSVDSNISSLEKTLANINSAQAQTKGQLSSSPQMTKTLLSVERQQLVVQQLYMYLLQKREENELTKAFTADNTRIITPPYGKSAPVAPKKKLIVIFAFIVGLAVPAGALFIAESSNTKIRSKKDLEKLSVPFAGEIPQIGRRKSVLSHFVSKKRKRQIIDKPRIVVKEGVRDIPNEAFRVVRANVDFMVGKGNNGIIALTSFNPGSGKSFIAYNLGASFAIKGKKVLIIDGDLRHGSISTYVGSPRKGLSSYLMGDVEDWRSLVVNTDGLDNLSVLPIGTRPPNPAELLENPRLEQLISQAKETYDVVLIDCPPVNIVVDTQIINQYVSRTIFVVRAGLLEKKALTELAELVDEKKYKNITVLLNGTKTEHSSYHTYGNYEAIDNG